MNIIKLIGLLTAIMHFTACAQTIEKNTQTKVFKGWKSLTENNYSVNYPDNWELNKSGQMETNFILFSPLSSEQDQFKENVNLLIQDLAGHHLDLNKYVEISEGQIEDLITDGKILDSKRITSEKLHYQKVIYTGKQGIFNLKFEQYYWVIDDKAFILTLTCEESQYNDFQVIGEKILNSFNFIKN